MLDFGFYRSDRNGCCLLRFADLSNVAHLKFPTQWSLDSKENDTGEREGDVCLFVYTTTHCSLKAYCAILVRRSNFRHQASPRLSPRESTQRRKVELWARNVWEICLNADLHVTFKDLLHAVKLRHGTDGFTSFPKEGVLRIFSP
jgi:hypothetical protein